jgi:hypothetical protein
MSEMSEKSRARAKDKLTRLMSKSPGKVDASGWTENSDQKGNVQTGMRVLSRRAYRAGGLVASGVAAAPRADRKPRAKGGGVIDDLVNVEMKKANGLRDGEKHIGGLKAGGKATAHKAGCSCAKCSGGRIGRASGGRTKKGAMNVNIIIAQTPKPALAAPQGAPLPPNAGPLGLHQGAPPPSAPAGAPAPMMPAPMMRKRGGRAYPIDTGGGGGKARLAKAAAYG